MEEGTFGGVALWVGLDVVSIAGVVANAALGDGAAADIAVAGALETTGAAAATFAAARSRLRTTKPAAMDATRASAAIAIAIGAKRRDGPTRSERAFTGVTYSPGVVS